MTDPPSNPGPQRDATWNQVQAAFDRILELEPVEREAMLAEWATRSPALASEVRSLLQAHAASGEFLNEPPSMPAAGVIPGARLGPYRILEEIGHGGIGVVYRATRDDEAYTQDVAIKLIDPVMRTDEVLRRFRAERQILAMLEHPNIARLLDGGSAPDGNPYLVMEYVDGQSLLSWCDARGLSIEQRLELFLVVCDAVRFAHERLVVHRDLKSDNILVTADGSPRLLDFGIAKLISPDGEASGTLTAPAHRMYTPEYASPEQIRGEAVTVSSDVYSLGVVLYELLTGARPHRLHTRTPEAILRVLTQEDSLRPSTMVTRAPDEAAARMRGESRQRLSRRLSGDLDYIVLKALERDPVRRYASVDPFAQDLRRTLANEPVLARGGSAAYLASRFVRRHRASAIAAGLIVLSLVGGLVGTTWQARVASRERDRATRRFNDVREFSRAVLFDLHDSISSLPGSTRARELLIHHALRYLERLGPEAKGDLGLQHEMGVAYAKIGDVQGRPEFPNLGQTTAALESYARAIALLQSAYDAAPDSLFILRDCIIVSQHRAELWGSLGHHEEALAQYRRERDRITKVLADHPDDPLWKGDLCVASDHLVDLWLAVGDTSGAMAESHTNVRLAAANRTDDIRYPEARRGLLIAFAKLANLEALHGDRDSAQVHFRFSEALAQQAVVALPKNTDATRDLSIIYGMHAMFLADGGQIDSALARCERSAAITAEAAAADPANSLPQIDAADGLRDLGTILLKGQRHTDAELRFAEAWRHYGQVAERDTANADVRTRMARCGRQAASACRALAGLARSEAERSQARDRTAVWLERSLAIYRDLHARSALSGGDTAAPGELERELSELRSRSPR